MTRVNVLGIAGSLREGSYNRALLTTFEELAPPEVDLTIHDLRGLPLYDADVEARGDPETVVALKEVIDTADVVLFATPEYNGGMPGALKNAIDWASRPPRPLEGKPCAVIGAAAGRFATTHAQMMLRHVLTYLGCPVLTRPTLYVASARTAFEGGELVDPKARERLAMLGPAIVEWVTA